MVPTKIWNDRLWGFHWYHSLSVDLRLKDSPYGPCRLATLWSFAFCSLRRSLRGRADGWAVLRHKKTCDWRLRCHGAKFGVKKTKMWGKTRQLTIGQWPILRQNTNMIDFESNKDHSFSHCFCWSSEVALMVANSRVSGVWCFVARAYLSHVLCKRQFMVLARSSPMPRWVSWPMFNEFLQWGKQTNLSNNLLSSASGRAEHYGNCCMTLACKMHKRGRATIHTNFTYHAHETLANFPQNMDVRLPVPKRLRYAFSGRIRVRPE